MHQPVRTKNYLSVCLIERLITEERNSRPTGHDGMKAELLFLHGMDIEALQMNGTDIKLLAILQSAEINCIL